MKAVVLLSGGVDSALTLALAVEPVEALTVDYGQRHAREIDAAQAIAAHYDVPWRRVNLDRALFEGSALTTGADLPTGHAQAPDATYVPARNTVLLALATARAEVIGARMVVIGANADDAAGYPDCRASYIQTFRDTVMQGTVGHVWIDAPLLTLTKADVLRWCQRMEVPVDLTWSCYAGGDQPCGTCGACVARQ